MASKKLSTDTSLANSYKLSRGVASVARPSAPTIGTATDGGSGLMSVTFTASTLGPTASSFSLTSSSGVTGSGASSPLTLQEVATGTYTYSVSGVNANGTGPSSAASNSVVVSSVDSSAYFPIATTTLASATATVTFSSIPATYTHLQVRSLVRTDRADIQDFIRFRFNSDSGSNYSRHWVRGDGGTADAGNGYSTSAPWTVVVAGASAAANIFGVGVTDILDYTSTNKNKTVRTLSGIDDNSTGGRVMLLSNLYFATPAAITSIEIASNFGTNLSQYSSFTLYGIKG